MNGCSSCFNNKFCENIGRCFRAGLETDYDSDVTDLDELNDTDLKKKKAKKPDKINNFDQTDFLKTIIYS